MTVKVVSMLVCCGALWALKHYHGWGAALPALVGCIASLAGVWTRHIVMTHKSRASR